MTTNVKSAVSLIGLPYLMGTRAPNAGYKMAQGPVVLLQESNAPAAMRRVFSDVTTIMIEDADEPTAENTGGDFRLLPVGDQMSRILVQNIRLAQEVKAARASNRITIACVGACSASLGMVGGIGDAEGPVGMIWFDAHGDAQTPDTSENGFLEGMPVTTIAGKCWPKYRRKIPGFNEIREDRIITIGLNEMFSPTARKHAGDALGWLVHRPEIERLGFEGALAAALDDLKTRCKQVYIHFDTDVLDPSVLKANTHAAVGGITDEQASVAFAMIGQRFEILAVSFASYDPVVDPRGPQVLVPLIVQAAKAAAGKA
ncbi:arginase (plasmid) [Agrobacterium tumefaciens]|jgi:arginase|nr:arginase [Agrobacterium tumefaciens]QAB01100.1 arginase [Agrobacterium tumefaciens]